MAVQISKHDAELVFKLTGKYDLEQLRAVHKQYLKEIHPDRSVNYGIPYEKANDLMAFVNEAYAVLKKQFTDKEKGYKVESSIPNVVDLEFKEAVRKQEKRKEGAKEQSAQKERQKTPKKPSMENEKLKKHDEQTRTESPKEAKTVHKQKAKSDIPLRYKVSNKVEAVASFIPFGYIFAVLSWTLPFVLFGGLNFVPSWKGFLEPSGTTFIIAYIVVPLLGVACAINAHKVDNIVRLILFGIIRDPILLAKCLFSMAYEAMENYANGGKETTSDKNTDQTVKTAATERRSTPPPRQGEARKPPESREMPPRPKSSSGAGKSVPPRQPRPTGKRAPQR